MIILFKLPEQNTKMLTFIYSEKKKIGMERANPHSSFFVSTIFLEKQEATLF